ncbi:MAG: PPK2 family polyphosphate kinase [Actinomycetota bacterium]
MPKRWVVPPGKRVRLDRIDPGSSAGAPGDKGETTEASGALQAEIAELQDRLWAETRRCVLIVLQGMDGSGKDGTIRHVFSGLAPQATKVVSFKAPTEHELAHDFLWRVHGAMPMHGEIGIFNRSHYEDVLVVRVKKLVEEPVWRARYPLINDFEAILASGGTTVIKLFLHISRDEQRKRFEERLSRPDKRWKFRVGDLEDRELWDRYRAAYEDAISATSTATAPWYVVPADRKWYRNWVASTILLETLRNMDPRYPLAPELGGVVIP